jgi:putative SOS response-associated peptidase YedK
MCYHFLILSDPDAFLDAFDLEKYESQIKSPRWHVRPTELIPVVGKKKNTTKRGLIPMKWGLVPRWANDATGLQPFNARSETIEEKPAFRESFLKRRCLIPADGFYEWQKLGEKRKQAYRIELTTPGPFAFAGIWDWWATPDGGRLYTCCILTTSPNELMAPIHDRMPVILPPADYATWLEETAPIAEIKKLCVAYDPGQMRAMPIDKPGALPVELPGELPERSLFDDLV